MGLKCRLLGHAYGEPEVERSREENGDEVVVTVREVQVCDRCGAEETVSKNREVTAIRSPSEVGLDAGASGPDASPAPPDGQNAPTGGDAPPEPAGTERSPPADSAVEPTDLSESPAESADIPTAQQPPESTAEQHAADVGEESARDDERGEVIDHVDDKEIRDVDSGTAEPPDVTTESLDSDAARDVSDDTAESQPDSDDGWETGSDEWDDVESDPDADDAVILDAGAAERDEAQWPEETDTDAVDGPAGTDESREVADEEVTNDAEIIDGDAADDGGDERVDGERDPGAWPERDDLPGGDGNAGGRAAEASGGAGASGGDGWPAVEGDDEGFDAHPGGDGDIELGGNGLTPEVNGHAGSEADAPETVEGVAVEEDPGIRRAERDGAKSDGFIRTTESGTLESDVPDDRIEFYCPNCGHARMAGASSLRAGDICPECKQGYIAERER
ncbi:DUF7093 family protein [Halobellus marinus]|uniref:DUF7093 family protein n=1 Tax=Halobellus TaxID=1073986 RepID=UPI0028B1335C|nr:hypothetical protein [Halobellus sp. DFY28]